MRVSIVNNAGSPVQRTSIEECSVELWNQVLGLLKTNAGKQSTLFKPVHDIIPRSNKQLGIAGLTSNIDYYLILNRVVFDYIFRVCDNRITVG